MQPTKFRILSAITAGSLTLGVAAAITVGSGSGHAAQPAALAAQTGSVPPGDLDKCPTLWTGYSTGSCVVQLQTELNTILGLNLSVDGTFGLATKNAVERFQQEHNIVPADGIVGPQTKAALDNPGPSSAGTPPGQLNPGQWITSGTQIASPDGKFVLQMQSDGNLVLRAPGNIPIRDTHTAGHDGTIAVMQTDGNFVLRAPGNIPVWASGTDGHPGAVLQVQDDGAVVLYAPEHQVLRVIFPASPGPGGSGSTPAVPPATTSGTSTMVTTPSYTVVRYLQQISVPSCLANLAGAKIPVGGILCGFLANSANTYPPNDLSGTALSDFIAKKQYRQYVNYPSYNVTCVGGTIQNISSATTSAPFSWSLGYTRIQGPGTTNYFSLAEPYTENNNFDRTSPDEIYNAGKSSVEIVFQDASRLATTERSSNYALTILDAPFIWTDVREDVSCNGTYGLTVTTDTVPTTDIYINGHEVSYDKQSSNLGAFLKEGGHTLNPVGYGNLAYPCHVKHFNTQGQIDNTYTGCENGFQSFEGGQSGGGGASGSW
jgi:peptidoglycan hydrolase-like protein with peptidoglycan-binding domain